MKKKLLGSPAPLGVEALLPDVDWLVGARQVHKDVGRPGTTETCKHYNYSLGLSLGRSCLSTPTTLRRFTTLSRYPNQNITEIQRPKLRSRLKC